MNIGEASQLSGIQSKLIRHYEAIGLIPKVQRSGSGYRVYTESDVHILIFVKRARNLGFSMKEIKKLIGLWRNKTRKSSDVKNLVLHHIEDMEHKIQELQEMVQTLKHLSQHCQGDHRPNCPILNGLAGI